MSHEINQASRLRICAAKSAILRAVSDTNSAEPKTTIMEWCHAMIEMQQWIINEGLAQERVEEAGNRRTAPFSLRQLHEAAGESK